MTRTEKVSIQQDGEWRDGQTSFKVNVCPGQAEHLAESLAKGDRVLVTGRLRQRSWETPEGDKRSVTELEADEVGASLKWATAKVERSASRGNGERSTGREPAGRTRRRLQRPATIVTFSADASRSVQLLSCELTSADTRGEDPDPPKPDKERDHVDGSDASLAPGFRLAGLSRLSKETVETTSPERQRNIHLAWALGREAVYDPRPYKEGGDLFEDIDHSGYDQRTFRPAYNTLLHALGHRQVPGGQRLEVGPAGPPDQGSCCGSRNCASSTGSPSSPRRG